MKLRFLNFFRFSRKGKAKELKRIRRLDKDHFSGGQTSGEHGYRTNDGLAQYNRFFGVDFASLAGGIAAKKGGPIRVLDIGAGEGIFGIELQRALGRDKIELYANSLMRPYGLADGEQKVFGRTLQEKSSKPWKNFRSYRVGRFEKKADVWYQDKSLDLIISNTGRRFIKAKELELIARKLSPIGVAFIKTTALNKKNKSQIIAKLQNGGFKIEINPYVAIEGKTKVDIIKISR